MKDNYQLSMVIPARNEMFLKNTVEDILKNKRGKTEIIVGLDGSWADPPLEDHPDITILYYPQSIGQRAMTNQCVKLSHAKWIMKSDAHCLFDEGFDVKLMADMQDNWTMIPALYNLHAFNWKCKKCGKTWYQGPTPTFCKINEKDKNEKCDNTDFEREMVWKPRLSRRSEFYRFDKTLHFQYWSAYKKRPEAQGDIVETMSAQGSCFMLTREKYWELDICEEEYGSWGQQGTEVALKTWLSGGRLVTNKKTWYSHMFRTQGLDFGFPYPISGRQVENARRYSRKLFLENTWKGQIYPLSWLIEKFKPIPDWHEESGRDALAQVTEAGTIFVNLHNKLRGVLGVVPSIPSPVANHTTSVSPNGWGQQVAVPATSLPSLSGSGSISHKDILGIGNESKVGGVTTSPIVTNVVKDGNISTFSSGDRSNKPGIQKPVDFIQPLIDPNLSISPFNIPNPVPASSNIINSNLLKDTTNRIGGDIINNKSIVDVHNTIIPQKSIIYYTDNQLNWKLAHKCRKQILKAGLPIVSVSLKPLDFGDVRIVLNKKRGYEAYFKQILTALENSTADIIFFCEHDFLYSLDHFDFTPSRNDTFYYNWNWWRVRSSDGYAVHYDTQLVPGIVAYKELLISYYKQVIVYLEKVGFTSENANKVGFEPGTHKRVDFVGNYKVERFDSKYPILDIRHDSNLTASKWSQDDFRSPKNCQGWIEGDLKSIPGWDAKTNDFSIFLKQI